jgi:hypothetical protein
VVFLIDRVSGWSGMISMCELALGVHLPIRVGRYCLKIRVFFWVGFLITASPSGPADLATASSFFHRSSMEEGFLPNQLMLLNDSLWLRSSTSAAFFGT